VFLCLGVPEVLDVQDCLVEVTLIGILVKVQKFHIALEVLPVVHVPRGVGGEL